MAAARTGYGAGMHYVVLNLLGSTLFLFAVGLFYGVLGTLNMADLAVRIAATPPENLALVRAAGLLLFGVFALKAALLPLHLWLPAAYASAAAPVAALFAIMTKVGAYCILRTHTLMFGAEAGPLADLFQPWLLPLALATLAFGMLGVLAATRLTQQAAYLVVASIGTLLIAFGLGSIDGLPPAFITCRTPPSRRRRCSCWAMPSARRRGAIADSFESGRRHAARRAVGRPVFRHRRALAGLPPLSGFIGKFMILHAALGHPALPWVWSIVLATALLGLIALARSGSLLFFRAHPDKTTVATRFSPTSQELVPIVGLLALAIGLTLWAGPASDFARAAAAQLLQPEAYIDAVLGGAR